MGRVFAFSDLHVDSRQNLLWVREISRTEYQEDALILAGDVSDRLDRLKAVLQELLSRFKQVFFVPGNHELWVRGKSELDSIQKFEQVVALCDSLGVYSEPEKVSSVCGEVWIVPLYSWYSKPEESADSLYVAKPGEDPTLSMWSDHHFTRWGELEQEGAASVYFLRMNESRVYATYDGPVISFSHFLPRRELIFSTVDERVGAQVRKDPYPSFNFSRVAGCAGLDRQVRRLGSKVHVYGHQHRNRWREIDGVTYVSHCLGYPREREQGQVRGMGGGPRLVWEEKDVVN